MKNIQHLNVVLFLLSAPLFAQQVNLQLQTPVPAAPFASANVQGNGGNATYAYYVVVHYAGGTVVSQPVTVQRAAQPLASGNLVNVGWLPLAGASSYDVLRLVPPATFSGSCTCSLATGLTTTNYADNGGALSSYTVATGAVFATGSLYINNRDYTPPQLRQVINGIDSAVGGSGGGNNTFCVDATGSTSTYTCPTPTPAITTLNGLLVSFIPQTTNTGASTLNVESLGVKTLKKSDCTTDLSSGDLVGGTLSLFGYNGTVFCQTDSGGGSISPGGSSGSVQFDKSGNLAGILAFVLGTDDYLMGTPDSAHRDPAPMSFCTGSAVYFPYPACIPTQIFYNTFPNNVATGAGLDCAGFDTATCSQEPPADLIVKGIIQTVASGTYNTEWVVLDTGTNFVDNAELVSVTALGSTVQWLHANSLSTPNVYSNQEAVVIDNSGANVRQISSNVTNVSMRHGTAFQAFGAQPTVGMDCGAGGTCDVTERMAGDVVAANGGANGLSGFLVGLDVIMTANVKNTTLCAGSSFYASTSATTSTCGILIDDIFGADAFSYNPILIMGGAASGTNPQLSLIAEGNVAIDGSTVLGTFVSSSSVLTVGGSGAVLGTGANALGGTFTTTTTGAMTVTLTFPATAPNGYACNFSDRTTGNLMRQTSTSTTTAVVQGTSISGDTIQYSGCTAY